MAKGPTFEEQHADYARRTAAFNKLSKAKSPKSERAAIAKHERDVIAKAEAEPDADPDEIAELKQMAKESRMKGNPLARLKNAKASSEMKSAFEKQKAGETPSQRASRAEFNADMKGAGSGPMGGRSGLSFNMTAEDSAARKAWSKAADDLRREEAGDYSSKANPNDNEYWKAKEHLRAQSTAAHNAKLDAERGPKKPLSEDVDSYDVRSMEDSEALDKSPAKRMSPFESGDRKLDRLLGEHSHANMQAQYGATAEERAAGDADQKRLKKEISDHYKEGSALDKAKDSDDREDDSGMTPASQRPIPTARVLAAMKVAKDAVAKRRAEGAVQTGPKGGTYVETPGGGKRYVSK